MKIERVNENTCDRRISRRLYLIYVVLFDAQNVNGVMNLKEEKKRKKKWEYRERWRITSAVVSIHSMEIVLL